MINVTIATQNLDAIQLTFEQLKLSAAIYRWHTLHVKEEKMIVSF